MSEICAAAKDWGDPDKAIMIMTTMCRRSDLNCIGQSSYRSILNAGLTSVAAAKGTIRRMPVQASKRFNRVLHREPESSDWGHGLPKSANRVVMAAQQHRQDRAPLRTRFHSKGPCGQRHGVVTVTHAAASSAGLPRPVNVKDVGTWPSRRRRDDIEELSLAGHRKRRTLIAVEGRLYVAAN